MLPTQKRALKLKTKEWRKDTIDYYDKLSYSTTSSNRSTQTNKKINYDLFNGIFNQADLEYVCNPLGLNQGDFPASLRHYDIVSPAFNLLIGEETKRNDNCIVISDSPLDLNRKQGSLKKQIVELLQQKLMAEIDPSTVDPEQPLPTPEEILKYEQHTVTDLIEGKANKLLKHLKKYLNTKEVFKKGWKDALLAGEEIYWTGVSNNEVIFRRCNPLNMTVILDNDTDFIDDAQAIIEVRMMSISSIMDEMGDDISPDDLMKLEQLAKRYESGYKGGKDPVFTLDSKTGYVVDTGNGSMGSGYNGLHSSNSDLLRVVRVEWKSFKKLYHLTYTDELGEQELIVDEGFNLTTFKSVYPDAQTTEFWVPEAWEGIKIDDDIYLNIGAKPNQRRRMDNPYYCKLGYVGLIYNATNSISVSLMDRVKAYQYLYNIFMYRLELAFAMDQGKKFIMDIAQIPRSEGIDVERWMYYFKAMGIAFINSHEEGRKGTRVGQVSNFNQFQAFDLSLANTIQQYINTLDYIKQQIAFISGVTPQRLGAIENRELVGNVERSVQQSALITEYLFDSHDEVKRRCYTAMIECAKIAYKDGKKVQYVLDDMGMELLELDEMELENSEFNTFTSNANKDHQVVESLKQLSQIAIQRDKADLSTLIETIVNDNPRDIIRTLKRSEQEAYKRMQEAQKQQSQIEQQKIQSDQQLAAMEAEQKQLDRDLKQYEIDSNNETKIMVAEISALRGVEGPSDMDGDGIPDPVEIAKLSLEQRNISSKEYMEREKVKNDKDKHDKDLQIKDRELKMKKEIEDKKIEAIKVQNISQEKIAREANKLKEKELELKKNDLKTKVELEKIKLEAAKQKAKADAQKSKIAIQKARQTPKKPKK